MNSRKILIILLTAIDCMLATTLVGQTSARDSLLRLNTSTYLFHGKVDSAIITASKLKKNDSSHFRNLMLATLYETKRDTTKANSYFAASLAETNADSAETYYLLAMSYYHRNNIPFAKNNLLISVRHDDTKSERHFLLGKLYEYLNERDSAILSYEAANHIDPENLSYIQALYAAYSRKGMVRTALPYLKQWVLMDTTNVQILLTLTSQWMDLDSCEAAMPMLDQLAKKYSTNDSVYYQMGLCRLQLKDTAQGVEALRIAIRLASSPGLLYYEQLIGVYEAQGKVALAIDVIEQGGKAGLSFYKDWLTEFASSRSEAERIGSQLSHDPQSSQLTDILQLAAISIFQKDDFNALARIKEYGQLGGTLTDSVLYMQFVAELRLGRLGDARADIQKAIAIAPDNIEYQAALANVLFQQKDYTNLIGVLLKLPVDNSPYFTQTERDAL